MKVLLDHNPLAPSNAAPVDFRATMQTRPAWVTARQPQPLPDVTAYRLQVDLPQAALIRVHVSADFDLPVQGFKTTPEQPEPSCSDCQGWGAHPLYHFFATLLGIRPVTFGFDEVEVAHMPGHLIRLSGEMVHPRGRIVADLHFADGQVRGTVTLPIGLYGTFCYAGKTVALQPGVQSIAI